MFRRKLLGAKDSVSSHLMGWFCCVFSFRFVLIPRKRRWSSPSLFDDICDVRGRTNIVVKEKKKERKNERQINARCNVSTSCVVQKHWHPLLQLKRRRPTLNLILTGCNSENKTRKRGGETRREVARPINQYRYSGFIRDPEETLKHFFFPERPLGYYYNITI